MPRKPTCLCGECPKCKRRVVARERYQAMTSAERRALVARRDRDLVRAADRARYYRDQEKRRAQHAKWRAENPDKMNASRAADLKRSPERRRAYKLVQRALGNGRLVRPAICEDCGGGGSLHAHHDDYAKPLDVRWLCPDCHGRVHRQYDEAAAA